MKGVVIAYLTAMRDSDLGRAEQALSLLSDHREEAIKVIERLAADQIPPCRDGRRTRCRLPRLPEGPATRNCNRGFHAGFGDFPGPPQNPKQDSSPARHAGEESLLIAMIRFG